jgi:hypothetical protein
MTQPRNPARFIPPPLPFIAGETFYIFLKLIQYDFLSLTRLKNHK